DDTAVYYCAR
nr:immunoglobulin heavy chain junction region [Homo sapiens]